MNVNEISFGNYTFYKDSESSGLWSTKMKDYTIITNADFSDYIHLAPTSLREIVQENWQYVLHVANNVSPSVTRSTLQSRVLGGQILAYSYTPCSIEGNQCVYYGMLTTKEEDLEYSHKICRISSTQVWPRKLYVYLRKGAFCNCSTGCFAWGSLRRTAREYNSGVYRYACLKRCGDAFWRNIYVMMGEGDECSYDAIKEGGARTCEVCTQCFECSQRPTYCRKHKTCKHVPKVLFGGGSSFVMGNDKPYSLGTVRVKQCKKLSPHSTSTR